MQSKRMKVCEYSEVSSGEKLSMKAWDTELKKKTNLQNFNRRIDSVKEGGFKGLFWEKLAGKHSVASSVLKVKPALLSPIHLLNTTRSCVQRVDLSPAFHKNYAGLCVK